MGVHSLNISTPDFGFRYLFIPLKLPIQVSVSLFCSTDYSVYSSSRLKSTRCRCFIPLLYTFSYLHKPTLNNFTTSYNTHTKKKRNLRPFSSDPETLPKCGEMTRGMDGEALILRIFERRGGGGKLQYIPLRKRKKNP